MNINKEPYRISLIYETIPENGKEVIIKCKDTHDGRIFLTQAKIYDNWGKTLDRLSLFRVIEWFYVEDLL